MGNNEFIGRKRSIGFGKETTRGTLAVATYWASKESGILNIRTEKMLDSNSLGRIETNRGANIVKEWCEPAFGGNLRSDSIGLLLLSALGVVNTTANPDTSGNVYDHEFTVANTNCHQSLSVWSVDDVNTAAGTSEASANAMVQDLTITAEAGDYAKFEVNMIGKKSTDESAVTPSYADEKVFKNSHVTVKIADTAIGLDTADAIRVSRLNLQILKNLLDFQTLGNTDLNEVFNQNFDITGDMDIVFDSNDYRDLARGEGKKYMEINIKNTDVTIGDAANPEINIILNQVDFSEWQTNDDADGITNQTIGFNGQYNITDDKSVTVTLTNLVTTY